MLPSIIWVLFELRYAEIWTALCLFDTPTKSSLMFNDLLPVSSCVSFMQPHEYERVTLTRDVTLGFSCQHVSQMHVCVYQAGPGTASLESIASHDPQLKTLLLFLCHKSQVWPQEALSPALLSCPCLYLGLQPERWSAGVGLLGKLNCRPLLWFGPYFPSSSLCRYMLPPSVFCTLDWSQSLCGKVWTNTHP